MMKAIGYKKKGPISEPDSLVAVEIEEPKLDENRPHDMLVEVRGISVNPVDVKVRVWFGPDKEGDTKVIGYDAAGVVKAVGKGVTKFSVGDEVFYSGEFTRAGTNSHFHLVDERIAGSKPKSLGFAEASAMPLTAITAWEILFDSLAIPEQGGEGQSMLILGAAGGVGSILIQLVKKLTKLKVIATASRPETVEWVKKMGADHVINHRKPLVKQVDELKLERAPKYVVGLNGTDQHFPKLVELIQPRGHICIIDDPEEIDMKLIKMKALSFSWEFMFARSMFQTEDIEKQHELLNRVSKLLDDGTLKSTMTKNLGVLTVELLKEAHVLQESGKVIGKNVLDVKF